MRLLLHGVLRWLQCQHPMLAWLRRHPILLLLPVSRLGIRLLLHEGLLLCVWLLLRICLLLHVLLLLPIWLLLPI